MATIAIDDVTLAEGNVGNTNFNFTVSLSAPSGQVVQVNYGTTDGTAFASRGDYNPVSGTLIFAPGQTSQTISVPVKGDTLYAPNETFFVNLSNPLGATIADAQGVGTIVNETACLTLPMPNGIYLAHQRRNYSVLLCWVHKVNWSAPTSPPHLENLKLPIKQLMMVILLPLLRSLFQAQFIQEHHVLTKSSLAYFNKEYCHLNQSIIFSA